MAEQQQKRSGRYPAEMHECAARMVFEHTDEYPSQWNAIESIAAKLGINHETLRIWVRRAETDVVLRPEQTMDGRSVSTPNALCRATLEGELLARLKQRFQPGEDLAPASTGTA